MKHSWIWWDRWAFLASSAANQWACVCSVSGRYCSDFSGIRLNFVWLRNQERQCSVMLRASIWRPLWVWYLQLIVYQRKAKKNPLFSSLHPTQSTHKNIKQKSDGLIGGNNLFLHQVWWSALLRSSDLCLFICLFKTLHVMEFLNV